MHATGEPVQRPEPKRLAKRNPENSRRILITATLDTIAESGITDTSVSKIVERAGLSRGMIHLHFGGKQQLLAAAARAFADAYYKELDRHIALAEPDPETVLRAVIRADLGKALLNERAVRIWHAFRGAAPTSEGIARFSSTRDRRLRNIIERSLREIGTGYGPACDPQLVQAATLGLLALLEGMWVDYLSNGRAFSRDAANVIILRFMKGLFPNHFGPDPQLS